MTPTYVITTKYGKERWAELEIGDAVYEKDPEVLIESTVFKGVLLVYTKLSHEDFLNSLLTHPPAFVERIIRISFCCPVSDLINCTLKELNDRSLSYGKVNFRRKGSLKKGSFDDLKKILEGKKSTESDVTLSVEPIDDTVCFGTFKDNEDRVLIMARKRSNVSHSQFM